MPIIGEARTAGSEMPTRWDFRTSAMAAHFKLQGSLYFAFTAQVEVTYNLRPALAGLFFCQNYRQNYLFTACFYPISTEFRTTFSVFLQKNQGAANSLEKSGILWDFWGKSSKNRGDFGGQFLPYLHAKITENH